MRAVDIVTYTANKTAKALVYDRVLKPHTRREQMIIDQATAIVADVILKQETQVCSVCGCKAFKESLL